MIKKFTDLEAWKEAHALTLRIYHLTQLFPQSEVYGLNSQIRRACVSIESCIAEGFSRFHYKDRLNFYYNARGSLAEVEAQLIIAHDISFIEETIFTEVTKQVEKVRIILGGLIRSTNNLAKK